MSQSYAHSRLLEALDLAAGNRREAEKIIAGWVLEDSRLMSELAKPHMSGIIAYNMDRVLGKADGKSSVEARATAKPKKIQRQKDLKESASPFGKELLKAVTDTGASVFGMEEGAPPSGGTRASQQHMNAIRMMAARRKK